MISDLLLFVFLAAFFVRAVVNILYGVWLWQLKEYRFDRLFVYFKETKEGRRFLFHRNVFLFWLLVIGLPLTFIEGLRPVYAVCVTAVFLYDVLDIFRLRRFRRPVFTLKAIVLLLGAGVTVTGVSSFLPVVFLVVVDRLVFPIVSLFVLLLSVPTVFIKIFLIELAHRKRAHMGNLIVIGVTGSYGKSSTKDLIGDFLSEKYNVLKTTGSVNTDLGIALFMLQNLKPTHEVFVVEIGAYKRGEIASVCSFVKPTIGVVTGINEQHLSLFGNLDNTKKAKMELIEALSTNDPSAFALFNGEDPITSNLSKDQKIRTHTYFVKQLPAQIRSKKNPFLSNVAAAYILAQKLGVSEKSLDVKLGKALSTLGLKTIKKQRTSILDDSFNTNPKGFDAALDVLASYKDQKILVTPGIIELGSDSGRIHRALGQKIGTICDVVVLTTNNFEEPIRDGLGKTKFDMAKFFVPKREQLVRVVVNQLQAENTLLLEGRMPAEVTQLVNQLTS